MYKDCLPRGPEIFAVSLSRKMHFVYFAIGHNIRILRFVYNRTFKIAPTQKKMWHGRCADRP